MKYCQDCKYYWDHTKSQIENCELHPYYYRNRNHNCIDYKKKWFLFWVKEKKKKEIVDE